MCNEYEENANHLFKNCEIAHKKIIRCDIWLSNSSIRHQDI